MISYIGIIGAGLVLVAFFLNENHKLNHDSRSYDFINFAGSALLVIYSFLIASLPFMILNGIWALVSLKDLVIKKK